MATIPRIRRLVLLLALLPQLLVLGLGQDFVVCIAPGGHLQLEAAGSVCCADPTSASTASDEGIAVSQNEPDCGSCSDYRIVLDPRLSRSSGAGRFELPSDATALLPVEIPTLPVAADPTRCFGRPLDRGHEPPHLIHLRSVVLRC